MDNGEIARVFEEISRLLDARGDSPFKIRAYRTAARAIAGHPVSLRDFVAGGDDLRDIPGVGEAIAAKTLELLSTGKLEYLEKLKRSLPAGVPALLQIPGIGPKTAARVATELGVTSVDELESALLSGKVAELPGIGEKKAQTLLAAVRAHRAKP